MSVSRTRATLPALALLALGAAVLLATRKTSTLAGVSDTGNKAPPDRFAGPLARAIVEQARRDLGVTEQGGDNRGTRVEQMQANTGNRPGDAWCASAVSTWVFQAARSLGLPRPFRGSAGVKEIVAQMRDPKNPRVGWIPAATLRANPGMVQPGMIVAWTHRPNGEALAHTGVTTSTVDGAGNYRTIEGNAGAKSDRVLEGAHALSSPRLAGMGYFLDAPRVA